MAVPPQFRKAAKRRLDAPIPSNKASGTRKVATFGNPGNKAGQGLTQQPGAPAQVGAPSPDAGQPSSLGTFLGLLGNAPKRKPKTKVQPAASRKVQAMRMAASNATSPNQ